MTELEVHVVDQDIIVNLPGTRCTITFQMAPDSPSLIEKPDWTRGDEQAAITLPVSARSTILVEHSSSCAGRFFGIYR
jgi:hypothetical protein